MKNCAENSTMQGSPEFRTVDPDKDKGKLEIIGSFQVDHRRLLPGLYVSRKDRLEGGAVLTTFDLRFTAPNREPVMDTAAVHAIEHLGATYLRSDPDWKNRTVYFGPMGCRTGFYAIFAGDLEPQDVLDEIRDMCRFILYFQGEVPGASPEACGNWHDSDLNMAQYYVKKYAGEFLNNPSRERMKYPE